MADKDIIPTISDATNIDTAKPTILKGNTPPAPTQLTTISSPKAITFNVNIDHSYDDDEVKKNYFVRLPHSGFQFDVRGITVEEEDAIKSSSSTGKRAAEVIMKTLYNCISNDAKQKGGPLQDYISFTKNISIADRDTLAFAVIEKSYESTHDMTIRCPSCNKSFDESVCIPQFTSYKYYRGEVPILSKRQEVIIDDDSTEFKTKWKLYFKIPTLADELKILNMNGDRDSIQAASTYIFIDRLDYTDIDDKGHRFDDSITNSIAIYGMIKKRPAIMRKRIMKAYKEFEGDYGVDSLYETSCKYCGSPINMRVFPIMHFLELVQ